MPGSALRPLWEQGYHSPMIWDTSAFAERHPLDFGPVRGSLWATFISARVARLRQIPMQSAAKQVHVSSDITVKAGKFKRLLDYLEHIGLESAAIARTVNIAARRVEQLGDAEELPARQYARLYQAAVTQMQRLRHPIPWGAGVGTEAFEFMCRSIISSRTLGEALRVAERYDRMMYPMIGYSMRLLEDGGSETVRLSYHVNISAEESVLVPSRWDRARYQESIARGSGLEVWCTFCGWLTGRALELERVQVAAPFLSQAYYETLSRVFRCPLEFDAQENTLTFKRKQLERRIVQTGDSLAEFLDSSIYHLIAVDRNHASTSAAIKSLIAIDLPKGMPSIAAVAQSLHMSESSLRRRLQKEETSYQSLKDEVRREVAVDMLLNEDEKIADIATKLGFTEPSSFVRSFKSWTGETPRSYQERVRALVN